MDGEIRDNQETFQHSADAAKRCTSLRNLNIGMQSLVVLILAKSIKITFKFLSNRILNGKGTSKHFHSQKKQYKQISMK